jgi:hypothetical protein
VIDAKTAHRLSGEQWARLRREALDKKLDAIGEKIAAAIKKGDWSLQLPYGTLQWDGDLTDALEKLGYSVSFARTKRYKDRLSWGAPKERSDG